MKTDASSRLFWFLKEGTAFDFSRKAEVDMAVQQTLLRGKISDIERLLKAVPLADFTASFHRVERFLPREVRRFWEEALGDSERSA